MDASRKTPCILQYKYVDASRKIDGILDASRKITCILQLKCMNSSRKTACILQFKCMKTCKKMACKYMDASRKMACILQFKYKDASRKIACILQNVMHLVIKRSLVYGRKIRNWWKYLPLFAFQLERVINILRSNSLFSNSCF